MADIFRPRKRSEIMSRIRSTGTAPERLLFRLVREAIGGRRRIARNVRTLPGQPDILIPSFRLVIFAHGCFYHNCPRHGHQPKSNRQYWSPKLAKNAQRDLQNTRKLRALGYAVWRLWEHDFKPSRLEATGRLLKRRLERRLLYLEE